MVLDMSMIGVGLKTVYKNYKLASRKTVPPKLDKSKIRLVIYSDTDRGRTPYYDSNSITRVEDFDKNVTRSAPKAMRAKGLSYSAQKESQLPHQKTPKYSFHRLGSDVKVLEEMMFGTAALAFKGSTLKVHLLRSPPQLMVSKVFIPEKPNKDAVIDTESDSSSLPGSSNDFSSGEFALPNRKPSREKIAKSIPVDVPNKELLSDYSTDDDSGLASFTSSGSLRTPFPSPSNNSISSYNSLHRRWMRAQTTSLDGHHRPESSLASENSVTRPRRNKLAIAILFGSHDEKDEESNNLFQSFFFSHFALIEGHVEKLRSVVEKAYFNLRSFLPATMEALEQFRNDIYDLYMSPRLPEPVWLTMMSTTTYKTKLCEKFIETFVGLVTKYDNKNCKFFVSTLLSAVLTQHLAWVATVTPAGGTPSHTYRDKHTAKWVDTLAKTHPYNPLWAQLGDLFGAIGLPRKISRTVVVGKKADVVKRFLYVLSYFIRCSEVHENSDLQCLSKIVNETQYELPLSPTLSEKTLIDSNGLDRSTSPNGCGGLLSRQTSTGSGGGGVAAGVKPCPGVDSHKGQMKFKFMDPTFEEDCGDHVKKTHSEPNVCCHTCAKDCHRCVRFERSDSGYNGNNFEGSHELEVKGVTFVSSQDDSISKSALSASKLTCDCRHHQSHLLPSDVNCSMCGPRERPYHQPQHINHVFSDSALLPAQTLLQVEDGQHKNPVSSSSVQTLVHPSSSTTPSAIAADDTMGLSELHYYTSGSIPSCCLSSAKVIESPSLVSVTHTGKSALTDGGCKSVSSDANMAASVPFFRSQSFSDGKVKSRLAQQLESAAVHSESDSDKTTKFYLDGGSCGVPDESVNVDDGMDDCHEADKVMFSSAGSSSSWVSTDGKKEMDVSCKPLISRQTSIDSKPGRPTSLAKCRSITPTDLSRRRHLSSTGSIDYEAFDPVIHCKEIKLPNGELTESGQWTIQAFDRNFGRSLLAGFSDHYMSDFVLQGTSDTNYKSRLLNDLQMTVKHSVLDEPIDEAVCVIADTDNWTVDVASTKMIGISPSGCFSWTSSQLVADLIESVVEISKMKMSAEFCLSHLEDRLQEIYFKSLMLAEYMRGVTAYSQRELTAMLGFESSDMPLLLAIAGTHTPSLALGAQ